MRPLSAVLVLVSAGAFAAALSPAAEAQSSQYWRYATHAEHARTWSAVPTTGIGPGDEDPFAKVYLVTSRALYEGGIRMHARKLADRRDGIGNALVIAEARAWQLPEISHGIHERERHCGGFFARYCPVRIEFIFRYALYYTVSISGIYIIVKPVG